GLDFRNLSGQHGTSRRRPRIVSSPSVGLIKLRHGFRLESLAGPVRGAADGNTRRWLMRTSIDRAALAALVLALACTAALQAAGEGRIIATVVDDSGAPIEGATVTITRVGTAKLEKVSDQKGQVMLLIRDATLDYQIAIAKPGYGPYQGTVKPKFEDTVRLTFTLPKAAAASKDLAGADQAIQAYNEGVAAVHAGDLAGAAAKLAKAAELDPKLAEAQAALAQVDLDLKRYGDSLAASDR